MQLPVCPYCGKGMELEKYQSIRKVDDRYDCKNPVGYWSYGSWEM